MDNAENRAYNLMERLNSREKERDYARSVIQSIFLYKKQKTLNPKHSKFYLIKLKKYLRKFSKTSNQISNKYDPSSLYEMMISNFTIMRGEIKMIKTNQDKILKYIGLEPIKFEIPSISKNEIQDSSVSREDSLEINIKPNKQFEDLRIPIVYRESDEEKLLQGKYLLIFEK